VPSYACTGVLLPHVFFDSLVNDSRGTWSTSSAAVTFASFQNFSTRGILLSDLLLNPTVLEKAGMQFKPFSPAPLFIGVCCNNCSFQVVAPVASNYRRLFAAITKNHENLHCRYTSLIELETKARPQPELIRDAFPWQNSPHKLSLGVARSHYLP
jgi:hypothetical protein